MSRGRRSTTTRTILLLCFGAMAPGCAKTVCDVLLDEQTQNGCPPQGGAGGTAPESCQGDVEKLAKCRVDLTDDACRPSSSEQAEIDACVND